MLGEDAWLGTAIADILTQQLATVPDYVLVERTRLNSFLDEMELQEGGFAGEGDAQRLGRVAKVDQVIYGNFARNGETLTITFGAIHFETSHDMGEDPGLQKDGVELELQRLLAETPDVIEEGLELIRREFPTPVGPVDLLCRDRDGMVVAVEVKRRGEIDGVEQLTRYLDFLNRDPVLAPVRGVFVAQEIKPQAKVLARDRDIECVEVDYDELRGIESPNLKLF